MEVKKDVSHRINKTDYVISVDFQDQFDEYQKINHLILLTDQTDTNHIFAITQRLMVEDIILYPQALDYVTNRVKGVIQK